MVTSLRFEKRDIVIRAYDLGGFGDIAGALRVTDYLARQGRNVGILPMSDFARIKLETLAPNYPHTLRDVTSLNANLLIDVAGHYMDTRVITLAAPVPHLFIEDMDNPDNRKEKVPLYIKTGLINKGVPDELKTCGVPTNPLFYRPFAEEEIPEKEDLDPIELIVKQMEAQIEPEKKNTMIAFINEMLKRVTKIGFAHFRPNMRLENMINSDYFTTVIKAAENSDEKYALCIFVHPKKEDILAYMQYYSNGNTINFVSKDRVIINDPRRLTVIALGPTPQMETSKMFLSSTIPSQVTGDLSLSDAIYFLLTREGQGFFYDCPNWKKPTRDELERILSTHNGNTMRIFGLYTPSEAQKVFAEKTSMEEYRKNMRTALIGEIMQRFGSLVLDNGNKNGHIQIPPGSPFVFQDAAGLVIDKLMHDKTFFEETEEKRRRLSGNEYRDDTKTVVKVALKLATTLDDVGLKAVEEIKVEEPQKIKKEDLVKYGNLLIERNALEGSDSVETWKKIMTYDESEIRIKKRGLQRHLRSNEYFGIKIDELEGKLDPDLKSVNYDMLKSRGEWLSLALEKRGNRIIAYLDPEELIWNPYDHAYEKINFKYQEKTEFNIGQNPSAVSIKLKDFKNDQFIKLSYGRKFQDLPEKIQEEGSIFLPFEGGIWPVCTGGDCEYGLLAFTQGASRGVITHPSEEDWWSWVKNMFE